jgi:hypothetical protein
MWQISPDRGLDVAVNDPFLMRVLHRLADRDEQFQPFADGEPSLVARLGDGESLDQVHDEVRSSAARSASKGFGRPRLRVGLRMMGTRIIGGAGVQHAGNIRMIHQC